MFIENECGRFPFVRWSTSIAKIEFSNLNFMLSALEYKKFIWSLYSKYTSFSYLNRANDKYSALSFKIYLSILRKRKFYRFPPTPLNFSMKAEIFWKTLCFFVRYCGLRGLIFGRIAFKSVPLSLANSCFNEVWI